MYIMKRIFPLLIVSLVLLFAACDDKIEPIPTLEVNAINLDGTWQLTEWRDAPLADSTYVYVVLSRKDLAFRIYDNLSSMYPRLATGEFELTNDYKAGDVISGVYDYEGGAWNHEYRVTDLYEESMIWTATDDVTDVQKFVRVSEVPTYIVEAVRKVME